MSFQVQQFDFIEVQQQITWKFTLEYLNSEGIDFYAQQENKRNLYNFALDYISQLQSQIQKKKKKIIPNQRAVRKVCQKLLKSLKLKYSHFANDVHVDVISRSNKRKGQQKSSSQNKILSKLTVIESFKKLVSGQCKHGQVRIIKENLSISRNYNCQKKVLEILIQQLSLSSQNYFQATHKYLFSHTKDCKRLNPDYDLLNQLYLVVLGDENIKSYPSQQVLNTNKILVDINLTFDQKFISQSFLWNPQNTSSTAIENFTNHFIRDTLANQNINVDNQTLRELQEDAKIQLKTQVCYKSLLKKFAPVLLNFSTMELTQDIKEYCIQLEIKLCDQDGQKVFEDSFEWDILNDQNNVQAFCQRLIEDAQLPKKYFTELCFKIRTQINAQLQWKFQMLVKTYKSILRDRQSPKFHTQSTITQIKKNLAYTMDVSLPFNPDQNKQIQNLVFTNSQLLSLLTRNMDILPQEFQQSLTYKENEKQRKKWNILNRSYVDEYLKKNNITIQSNKYLNNYGNSYLNQNIWKRTMINTPQEEKN